VTTATLAPPDRRASAGGSGDGRRRKGVASRRLTRGPAIGLGLGMLWFSLLVLIPLLAVVVTASTGGWSHFWDSVTSEQTAAAIRLTVGTALVVTAVDVVMGTLIAWVLVRDRFFGQGALNVLIDIPFALPTIVAGLVLLSLYGPDSPLGVNIANTRVAVFLAFLFVTLPFVVRTV
jgi:sulfate/thiosulfate transport system permease protein